jgi:hypothetical protein
MPNFAHLPTVNLCCDALHLEELANSDADAVHVVIRDNAGFHLRDGRPSASASAHRAAAALQS